MRRALKWAGGVVAFLLLAVASLPFLIHVDQFRPTLEADLSKALGRQVTLGNLRLKILAGEVTADDLAVAEDPTYGKPAFLKAKSLHVGAEIFPFLFSRKLIVRDLTMVEPEITAVQSPSGDWNFSSLGSSPSAAGAGNEKAAAPPASTGQRMPLDLSVRRIRVLNGRVTLRRTMGHWKPLVLEQVNLEVHDFSATSAFPFQLASQVHGGGTLQLDGKAGPINPKDSAMTPLSLHAKAAQVDLVMTGLNDVAPGVAGVVSFEGTGESDGLVIKLKGRLRGEKMKLVANGAPATRPLELDYAIAHDLRKHSGTISQADVLIGAAAAHITGTYQEQGDAMTVALTLNAPGMPIGELEGVLPALAVVLPAGTSLQGGTVAAHFQVAGLVQSSVVGGTIAVTKTQLKGFEPSKRLASIEKLAGLKTGPNLEIETLSANLHSNPQGTSADDLKLVATGIGEVTGAGTVSPAHELNFQMKAAVHTSGLMGALSDKPIPFKVGGTASEPTFTPDVGAVVKEELKGVAGKAGGLIKVLTGK